MMEADDEAETVDLPVSQLWLEGATLEQLRRWVDVTTPQLLPRARAMTAAASVRAQPRGLSVTGWGPDGWLHALALEAEKEGITSLTIDGHELGSTAPFYAFTQRRPGRAAEVEWFDPLRGIMGDAATLSALVSDACGAPTTFDAFLFSGLPAGERLGEVTCLDEGRALTPARWEAAHQQGRPLLPALERLVLWGGSMLVFLVPLVLAGLMWRVTPRPQTLGDALSLAFLVLMLSGWLSFLPLPGPAGQPVRWWVRAAWFLAAPLVLFALLFFVGAPS